MRSIGFMSALRVLTLCSVVFLGGCTDSRPISSDAFTRDYVAALKESRPDLNVEVTGKMELRIKTAEGREIRAFLDNACDEYKQDPRGKADIIQRYLSSGLETYERVNAPVDRKNIVPIVKDCR